MVLTKHLTTILWSFFIVRMPWLYNVYQKSHKQPHDETFLWKLLAPTTLSITMTLSITTFSIMTLIIMTLSIMTLSIMILSITTLSIKGLFATFSILHENTLSLFEYRIFYCCAECLYAGYHYAEYRYAEYHYAECRYVECRGARLWS